ncbi:class II glutamine amidotransferase [Sandaracinus amylolyticus]|uniref:Glutamine amidotransferases class-II n=1 Tax=Sandaracinus amylolyticus TaxID=927083 RepID=A0A0F6YII4_9BACT|nr:class II glutamine amidotransferase [Sandaracinus amylolyticus]AKF05160.1 Glutamine amidotransferases class-II [Sandaracinus amylolyticus]
MCRLFGFRSVIPSQMHRSLVAADNALGRQSERHPDGWGVAYYVDGAPHVTRSPTHALGCALFQRVSGVVSSETVLAHVRKATQGGHTVLNCHPFQYGRWTFAHNGDVPTFARDREALLAEVSPRLRRFVLGETDSEVIFFMVLTRLEALGPLSAQRDVDDVMAALAATMRDVDRIAQRDADAKPNLLTVILTDGTTMVAHQGGKELHFSTHKRRCADRESCSFLAPHCEAPTTTGSINHLVLSSEPLHGENVWYALEPGEMVGVDHRMRLVRRSSDPRKLAVVA